MKPEYANIQDPFAIAISASLWETLSAYDVVGYVPREIKGCEVQEVSYSERWPRNINNDGGEKASPMVFN